jgi:hypothetical protein
MAQELSMNWFVARLLVAASFALSCTPEGDLGSGPGIPRMIATGGREDSWIVDDDTPTGGTQDHSILLGHPDRGAPVRAAAAGAGGVAGSAAAGAAGVARE